MKRKSYLISLVLSAIFFIGTHAFGATIVYEDAEDGAVNRWTVYDQTPQGAVVNNVFDANRNSNVVSLTGSGTANGYMLGNFHGRAGAWNNSQEKTIQWRMKFDEFFYIYISVQTQNGQRFLFYTNSGTDNTYTEVNGGSTYIHYGLGGSSSDGTWRSFTRDLEADLKAFEANNSIQTVDAFLVRGSGSIDDVKLLQNTTTTNSYEDAEDGNTNGWSIYDNSPSGAVINNIRDNTKNSRVIELSGNSLSNGYMLGNLPGKQGAWKHTASFTLQWSMNFSENYWVYIALQTEKGIRYMTYTPSDKNNGLDGPYVQHGLGQESKNGTWQTITRHLQADLTRYEPDNKIISVDAFLVRGSGKLDDIKTQTSSKGAGLLLSFDDKSVDLWYDYFLDKDASIKVTFFVHGWHTLSADQIQKLHILEGRGHEIAFHSYSHKGAIRNYGGDAGLQAYLDEEIIRGLDDMVAAGFNPVSFAYPYGEHTPDYDLALFEYFPYLRTTTYDAPRGSVVELDSIFMNIDKLSPLFSGEGIGNVSSNDIPELEVAFERAKNNREIISLVGHFIHPDNHTEADHRLTIRASELDQLIAVAQSKGLRFYTMKEVLQD